MIILLCLINCFDIASYPINNYSAYYNPASLYSLSAYEILAAPSDIGQVNFYSFSARFGNRGLSFSGSCEPRYANKNWFSFYQQLNLPLTLGANIGLSDYRRTSRSIFGDIGLFSVLTEENNLPLPSNSQLNFALVGYDLFNSNFRTLRAGSSFRYGIIRFSFEMEDTVAIRRFVSYLATTIIYRKKDYGIEAGLGLVTKNFCCGVNFNLLNFNFGVSYLASRLPITKFHIGLAFKERTIEKVVVKEKEVEKIKEVIVEKPIFIDRVVEKSKPKKKYQLTEKQKKFCETHYQLGIKYYTEGDLPKAIAEWEKVYALAPDYENVEVNLKNTKEKLKKIEEGEKKSE